MVRPPRARPPLVAGDVLEPDDWVSSARRAAWWRVSEKRVKGLEEQLHEID